MAAEGFGRGFGTYARPCVGMVDEHDGHTLVCGIFPGQSASVSGLLCDSADSYSSAIVSDEEMGLLDCMAVCEYSQSDTVFEGWAGLYADSELFISG